MNDDNVRRVGVAWLEDAGCRDIDDPDLFFPSPGDSPVPAQSICAGCGVSTECREYALAVAEPHGVWGGMTEADRKAVRTAGGGRGSPRVPPSFWVGLGSRRVGA